MSQLILNSGTPSDAFIAESRKTGSTPQNRFYFWMSGLDSGNPRIDLTDRLIDAGAVTREIKTEIGKTAQPVAAAITVSLSNDDGYLSDQRSDSLLYNRYYIDSHVRLWSGWGLPNGNTELLLASGHVAEPSEAVRERKLTVFCGLRRRGPAGIAVEKSCV